MKGKTFCKNYHFCDTKWQENFAAIEVSAYFLFLPGKWISALGIHHAAIEDFLQTIGRYVVFLQTIYFAIW